MEENIVQKAKNGDREAFAKIFNNEFRQEMYVIAKLKLNNSEDAKDAIQETILEAFKSISQVRDEDKVTHWIMKVLVNKCNNIFRYNRRFEVLTGGNSEDIEANDEFIHINRQVDLFNMLEVLDTQSRQIIFLHYRGYSSKEISIIMKTNESTIRSKIKRAKARIKGKYGRGDI